MSSRPFFEETLLHSVMIRLLSLIGGTTLLLSTWQRSLVLFCTSLLIQGAAYQFRFVNDSFEAMETKDDDKKIPTFDGRLDTYREYRRRALFYYHGLEDSKQSLAAPRLISVLSGSAFECFRERDPGDFRNTGGVKAMLDILDARYQYTPEQELSEWLETLLYKLRRQQGEETTAFTTRFETTVAKAEELMTEELKLERRRHQDMIRAEYRRQSLDFIVAQQAHQAALAGLGDGQDPPPAPVPPTPPSEQAPVVPFRMPEVMKGFLYLRHVGITLQTRASLLRSAGGSLRYEKVSELLRRTELDALVASRGTKDPAEASVGKGGSGKKGKGRDTRGRPWREGRSGRGDFQWRSGHASSSASRSQSHSRGKANTGKKPKGQGRKPKGAGKRSYEGRRGDPNGAQYLGWAAQAPSSSDIPPSSALPAEFKPEFSFMAFPRPSHGISELEVERCLMWDRRRSGHAIVDTGCTSTLVGSESEKRWNEELQKQSGGSLKAERGPSDVKFEGINGEARATYQVKYPVRIGGRDGFVQASVIPGKAPFLLSIQALRQMRAKLDCEADLLEIPGIGRIKLSVNSVGHYLLPLFDFHNRPSPPPGLEQGLSAATEAKVDGPEDENEQEADSRLAKDTKGPWIQLPKELAAVHLDWTECAKCAGEPLAIDASDARLFLFVFATKPQVLMAHHVHETSDADMHVRVMSECQCVIKEATTPPAYAHVGSHLVETFSNGYGQTWHCAICRGKCKICRGRVAKWVRSSGQLTYTHRRDCECTMIPGPTVSMQMSPLVTGDHIRVADAEIHLPKSKSIPYPFDIRKITMQKQDVHPKALPASAMAAPEWNTTRSTDNVEAIPRVRATMTTDQVQALRAEVPSSTMASTAMPGAKSSAPSPAPAPDLKVVLDAVKTMMHHEYGVQPTVVADVPMEKSLIEQAVELEGQAAELLARAAWLRRQAGLSGAPSVNPVPPRVDSMTSGAMSSTVPSVARMPVPPGMSGSESGSLAYQRVPNDPDFSDGWEQPFHAEPQEEGAYLGTSWPRLSPEVGVDIPVEPGLQLPGAWKATGPLDMNKRATRAQLRTWLSAQAWKIDRGSTVGLIEVYAGRGHLSDAHEQLCEGSEAIRLGYMYGQELRSPEGQWFTLSLIDLCKPRDVYVSLPSKSWCRWSSINERREPGARLRVLRDRLEGRKDMDLLFQIVDRQSRGHRHAHAQNPQTSVAWLDKRFGELKVPHGFVTFDGCALGLRHPRSNRPIRKTTTLFTTARALAEHISQFRCSCDCQHDRAVGSFRGRSVTTWSEEYSKGLAEALIQGMRPGLVEQASFLAPLHYDEHVQSNPVEQCYVGQDGIVHRAYPVDSQSVESPIPPPAVSPPVSSEASSADKPATVFKVTDTEMSKQLTLLQFPGRYSKLDLPLQVQTQLQKWSGLDVHTVVTSRGLKCFVNPPVGVVSTRRTTLVRSGGVWYFVEYNHELGLSKKKFRVPLNANLVVSFFGDVPAPSQPHIPAESQPKERPIPGAPPSFADARKVHEYLNRLHVGLSHPGRSEFIQHLRDAGAAPWLLQQASRFHCAVCDALKPPQPHNVVGGPKPRSFNSILSIDTLDLTLIRDAVQHRVFLLTAIDTATSFARVFYLSSGDAEAAVQSLRRGWIDSYGAPEYIYADPDTIFRSETFAAFLTRHAIVERLSAAQAPFQHGQIERLHRTIRQQAQRVFESEPTCSAYEAAVEVVQARNELMRVEGVSPAVLVFGKLPKAPPTFAEGDEDFRLLAERLQGSDPLYEVMMLRRVAARTAWVQSEVRDRTSRIMTTRSRPYKGPYYPGQVVLVYRRRKGDAANPGRHGVWLGPGEVIAVESTNDRLVPRVVYVTVHGRLFLCSPDQLRPVSVKAEWVMQKLQEEGLAKQRNFSEMRKVRGIDVRNERPSSAELELEYEQPESTVVLGDLQGEAEYDPYPQAPPTAPGTPVPGTPVPATPRLGPVRSAEQPPEPVQVPDASSTGVPTLAVPEDTPTPPGGEPSGGESLVGDRGTKRVSEFHRAVEEMSRDRSVHGPPSTAEVAPLRGTTVPPTVRTGLESEPRPRSRSPPPREGSFLSFSDFDGMPSDHSLEAWFSESQEHDYEATSVGLEFDVWLDEIQDEMSVCYLVREMALNASMARKRAVEVSERHLTAQEKAMFRAAKAAEWSQWVGNDVVELISRHGVDPRRVIASRWVLTWKSVPGEVYQGPGGAKAKARLVIRGFRDPDLGQFSTASPTLSRQGRHAIFTLASHYQFRVFTLDAKTAFLAGDQTSRTKPIYTELPKDLVEELGLGADVIARIKKVPYGLSEAPLAWYRRLTAELEKCGFEQVPADRCVYVLRREGQILGIVGAHVDDLLVAGCSSSVDPRFEEAMAKLVARLPFGERKYADMAPVLYTGLNVKQHPQTRAITIDQAHYVAKLKVLPTRKLSEGLLDRQGQTQFWSQLGALLWVAVNTRPDVAYDVSHFASYGSRPEKQHLVSLNKIVRTLQARDYSITFAKVAEHWDDLTLVVFSDAGHTSRPSGHSQSGTVAFWAPKEVLAGKEVRAVLADYSSCKIDRAVWSSYASELQAATISTDASINLMLLYEQVFYGLKARQVKEKLTQGSTVRALVTDNKGLYDSIQTEKPSTRQGVKMQSLVYQILYDLVVDYGFQTFWVNGSHMLADGLTKLSSSGAQVDAIRKVLEDSLIRITYCEVSGRKEQHEVRRLRPVEPANRELESSIDV
ncbi:GIP [Symbiodinium sp. CCMP2592]|nr:GIP [Symbiodinium sp. CCMP2592]